jgi:predicted nucleic acid-binding protein
VTLVDTSIWIGHLRHGDGRLRSLLEASLVLGHAFVIGELACGNLPDRPALLRLLRELPQAVVAEPDEVLGFIDRHGLAGAGIGYVDAHLLASAALTPGARLWSGDRRLAAVAGRLGLAVQAEG